MRVVKNAVEEGSESFGYMLCLAASLGYYVTFHTHARRNSLFALRRERWRGKYLSTTFFGRYGGHVRKTCPKKGQSAVEFREFSLTPAISVYS